MQFLRRLLARKPRRLPIVIISYNRGRMLKKVIASYRRQSWPTEIVVHDNGSDDEETLDTLRNFEREGVRIFRRPPIQSADELNLVDETVTESYRDRQASPYAVTDYDVDLSDAHQAAITVYLGLLASFPNAECVGPMLKISDISRSYPLFNLVMNIHIDYFWGQDPLWTVVAGRRVAYLPAPIDTTFAIHRAGAPFRRLKKGLRVYAPFEARHLDWYLPDGRDGQYHQTSSAGISHWNNRSFLAENSMKPLSHESYTTVERVKGKLQTVRKIVSDNPD